MGQPMNIRERACTPESTITVAVEATSNRIAIPTGVKQLRVVSWVGCYLNFGGSSVVAAAPAIPATTNDFPFPAGVEDIGIPGGTTYIAVIRKTSDGTLYLSYQKGEF